MSLRNSQGYSWQYRFRDLNSSSDDGKVHFQLVFKDDRSLNAEKLETKVYLAVANKEKTPFQEVESDEVLAIAYNLHAFLVTKIVAADPDFIKKNPLL